MNFKSTCNHCNGRIEFDASDLGQGETRTIECPHCHLDTTIFVPRKPSAAAEEPVWFGNEESVVEIRLVSGSWLRVRAVRLCRESHVQYVNSQKAAAMELLGGASISGGFVGTRDWFSTYRTIMGAVEPRLSKTSSERAAKMADEILQQEIGLQERAVFFPVGQIEFIAHHSPDLWRVASEKSAYIHDGGDFVTVTDTDGVVSSIRWSAVEHFRYDAKNQPD